MFKRFKKQDKWIQETDMKAGALTAYLKRNEDKIKDKYGHEPFNQDGKINMYVLERLANDDSVHSITRKRAQLALNLKRI